MLRRVVENMDDVNYNFQQLFSLLSGNIDGPHIAAGAIGVEHLEEDLLIPGHNIHIMGDTIFQREYNPTVVKAESDRKIMYGLVADIPKL